MLTIINVIGIIIATVVFTLMIQVLWMECRTPRRSKPYKNKAKILLPYNRK